MLENEQTPAPGDPAAYLPVCVERLRAAMVWRGVTEAHSITGGWEWTWSHRGVWTLRVGSLLEPGVELVGPVCAFKAPAASILAADQVVLLLQILDALPPAVSAAAGTVYSDPSLVAAGMPAPVAFKYEHPGGPIAPAATPADLAIARRVIEGAGRLEAGMGPGAGYAPMVVPDALQAQPLPVAVHTGRPSPRPMNTGPRATSLQE